MANAFPHGIHETAKGDEGQLELKASQTDPCNTNDAVVDSKDPNRGLDLQLHSSCCLEFTNDKMVDDLGTTMEV